MEVFNFTNKNFLSYFLVNVFGKKNILKNFLADYGLKWIGENLSNENLEDDIDDYCEDSDNQSLISTSRADNDHQSKFTYANKFYYPDNNAENSKKSKTSFYFFIS